jgi:hypothetical protein
MSWVANVIALMLSIIGASLGAGSPGWLARLARPAGSNERSGGAGGCPL